ncbi:uncharacterized protein J8A68_002687 [[Candida] subhashii]|uniref:Uncharacterized protein n=1 Tax=[Candida] subhashii TaxID=561895 RepID=A0A8J5UPV9_9ASCO|nr:uncharacterized protein J8A68_002687 [[Candida] subhashii]KAG7663827.1 hypothetical protein J8A68_002687 [[Candida] subhashii]
MELLTRVASDIRSNQNEYVQFFETGTIPIPLNLIQVMGQMTDESYTTLVQNTVVMSQLDSVVSQLPWYNSRIAGKGIPSVTAADVSVSAASVSGSESHENAAGGVYMGRSSGMFASFAGILLALI